jgi:hypothetical protein
MMESEGTLVPELPNKTRAKLRDELLSVKLHVTDKGAANISVMNVTKTGVIFEAWNIDGETLSNRKEFICTLKWKRDLMLLFNTQETVNNIGEVMFADGIPGILIVKNAAKSDSSQKVAVDSSVEWEKYVEKLKIGSETLINFSRTCDPWKGIIEGNMLNSLGRKGGRIAKENWIVLKNLVRRNTPLPPETVLML